MGVSLLCNTHRDHLFCSKGRWHDTLLPKSIEYMKSMTFNSRKKKKRIIIIRRETKRKSIDLGMKCTFQRKDFNCTRVFGAMMARIGRVKIMEGQKQSDDPKHSHLKILNVYIA